ncbi:MAG: hypothetical protein AB7O62_17060 [Pirellulales bacterium]
MKKVLMSLVAVAVVAAVFSLVSAPSAEARPQYNKAFEGKYVVPGSKIHDALGGKSNCNVCHEGTDKKKRNDYGKALEKALEKNEKDADKLDEALEKVAKEPSDADDEKSPTFGDLIKDGTLPVTK